MTKLAALLGASLGTLLLTASCASEAGHNAADVRFATGMIAHHAQAIEMADATIGREQVAPEVAQLAEEIRINQAQEIDTLSGWLRDWGEEVPETRYAGEDALHAGSHDAGRDGSSHQQMPGMMSPGDLRRLATAPDTSFERRWLVMMIEHHEGAVAMTDEVADRGESPDVAELAGEIASVQEAEVADMRRWLGRA